MRIPSRIALPILAALLVCGCIFAVLAWQLHGARGLFATALPLGTHSGSSPAVPTDALPALPAGQDQALDALRRGDIAALRGEWDDAKAAYTEAVQADGGVTALRKLAQMQLQLRDLTGARASLEALRKAGTTSEDLLLMESILLIRTGDVERARALLAGAPDSPQRSYASALLAIEEGRHDNARSALQSVAGGWEPVLRSYARVLLDAYATYDAFPSSPTIHRDTLLARALADVRECDAALRLLEPVVLERGDYRDAWIVQGYCHLATGNPAQATLSLEEAYRIDPAKPETQYLLARAYQASDDHAQALTYFQYALRNGFQPEIDVRRMVAREAAAAGNAPLALQQYEAILALQDAETRDYAVFADAAISAGKEQEALQAATRATERFPADAAAFELLGRTAMKTGESDAARSALQRALELQPGRSTVIQALNEL